MNSAQHFIIGMIGSFLVVALFLGWERALGNTEAMLAIIIGGFAGLLPDFLEPAKHWTHRKFWHSQRVMKKVGMVSAVTFAFVMLQFLLGFGVGFTFIVFAVPFSYFLHLAADMTTPAGLPK